MAHLKGIESLIHIRFENFLFSLSLPPGGVFSSAIARKRENRHKTKTKAHTRVIEGSIPMFSWSQNSFMKFLFYGPKEVCHQGAFFRPPLLKNAEIGIKPKLKHIQE